MRSHIAAGVAAGLLGGVAFGILMAIMMAPTPDGGRLFMMEMVGLIPLNHDPMGLLVGYSTMWIGWVYHLINSAIIGGIFALLTGPGLRRYGPALGAGTVYGLAWWVLGGLVLMPVLLGMPAFAPLLAPAMRVAAWGSLIGHLLYGLLLGAAYVYLYLPASPLAKPLPATTWRRQVER